MRPVVVVVVVVVAAVGAVDIAVVIQPLARAGHRMICGLSNRDLLHLGS